MVEENAQKSKIWCSKNVCQLSIWNTLEWWIQVRAFTRIQLDRNAPSCNARAWFAGTEATSLEGQFVRDFRSTSKWRRDWGFLILKDYCINFHWRILWDWLKLKKPACLNAMSILRHSDQSDESLPIKLYPPQTSLCEEFVPFQTAFFRTSDREQRIRLEPGLETNDGPRDVLDACIQVDAMQINVR